VSKLTLVRSKTDNLLVIKNKESAGQQQQQPGKSRAGRSLKPKRPKLGVDYAVDQGDDGGGPSADQQPDQDMQCKIVKVILENCKTSTTSPTKPSDVGKTVNGSLQSREAVEAASLTVQPTGEVSSPTPTTTEPSPSTMFSPSTSSEASVNVVDVASVSSAASDTAVNRAPSGGIVAASTWLDKTHLSQLPCIISTTSITTDVCTSVIASPASLRLTTPLNGVVNQLPLAFGQHVQRLQLLGHPAARNLPPVAAAQRWSVPLVNGAGTWLTLQPVASTSSASIMAPSPASFGLISAPMTAQVPPPRPPAVVVDQPSQNLPYVPVAHSSVINSPIKQFLDHTRCVPPPPPATDDAPTDLTMKTLRRLEENTRDVPSATVAPPTPVPVDDAPLDLCTKRPTPTADFNSVKRSTDVPTTKAPPVLPILTVPLCFPTGTGERPRVTVAGQVVPITSTSSMDSSPAIKLVQPPTPLLKIDAAAVRTPTVAAAGAFPMSPITILHPAFRQLSPFLCSPLLMTPFAASSATPGSVQRHPSDLGVPPSSSSS